MKSLIKKIFIFVMLIATSAVFIANFSNEAISAPRSKKVKSSLSQEEITQMGEQLNALTRKIYAGSLFSPKDNENMVNIKLKLDEAMWKSPSPEFAPLYYMEANLLKKRNYKNEAIECYQTIIENFSDTAFAPKATQELLKMGVKFEVPTNAGDSAAEE
ncbi:MAG: hypothetical protein PHX18_01345 [Candidatus Gastranaerophilales bacterium]|nr:hypothetical protein [Candidatus Gastranaerophilales bacterium]